MKHLEDNLQMAVADYLRAQYPQLLWFHCPNGGRRNAREAARFKRMGVLPGVADILMFWRGGKGAIELKSPKGTHKDTQKVFQHNWLYTGGQYAICRSVDEVIHVLKEWRVGATQCPSAAAYEGIPPRYTAKSKKAMEDCEA